MSDLPISTCLKSGIIETIKDIQKHGSQVATISPIHGCCHHLASVLFLEGIPTSPDTHGDGQQETKVDFGPRRPREILHVQGLAKNESPDHLGQPVQETVKRTGANVEVGAVDTVKMVSVEPVAGEKHGKEEDDVPVGSQDVDQAEEF